MSEIVIVSAARTPVGSFSGAFATTPAHDLGAVAIKAALERAGVEAAEIDEVILGQVLTPRRDRTGPQPPWRPACEERTAWGSTRSAARLRAADRHAADPRRRRDIIVAGARNRCLSLPTPRTARRTRWATSVRRHHDQDGYGSLHGTIWAPQPRCRDPVSDHREGQDKFAWPRRTRQRRSRCGPLKDDRVVTVSSRKATWWSRTTSTRAGATWTRSPS